MTTYKPNFNSAENLKCPICNGFSSYVFTSKHNRKIYECSGLDCGHFFTLPSTGEQGICVRDVNIEKESDESIHLFDERNERLLNLFMGLINKKDYPVIFMDFGAGNAHISRTFKRVLGVKARIYCLEPNAACQDLYHKYELLRLSKINDLNEDVDLIYMIEVIEHLENPIATLSQLSQYISKDGAIFLSTPVGKRLEIATNAYDTPSHLHFFTEKSLNLTLKKSGFSEISFKYYSEMYPLPSREIYSQVKSVIKKIVKKIFAKRKNVSRVNHLVGLTRPLIGK